jgi:hypothetical protein
MRLQIMTAPIDVQFPRVKDFDKMSLGEAEHAIYEKLMPACRWKDVDLHSRRNQSSGRDADYNSRDLFDILEYSASFRR